MIVGGGLAGLGAALTLVRARRSVVVIDAGHPRNAPAAHSHGYLTRDGAPPLQLLTWGRAEVRGYGGTIVEDVVEGIERRGDGGLVVSTRIGARYTARRVLVTTGLVDRYPDIPGMRERWGRDVVHCPFCFGWEHRDQPLAILGAGPGAAMQALMWRQWSDDVILFQHAAPELSEEELARLAARGIEVVHGEVAAVEIDDDRIVGVRMESGETHARSVVVVGPRFESRHELLGPLGIRTVEHPLGIGEQVEADPTGFTGVEGVWVAGNVLDVTAGVMQSAASGVTAAATINANLTIEDAENAVQAARED
ncbi:NAD(P)/FAD-dependent oxidoreductase [Amycolatopsis pretoriensis]|uniref:NAD(P)/FAD-dependent oxidoreductase n=1 Tax=Amycolatopsis pretoriensis TaxID=218821 RepID=UPI00201208E3|nr:NAD(P)/FAD-dependent oxidoreductase [Amycolatopsis pretoriensis]